jgi:hypothetical protein
MTSEEITLYVKGFNQANASAIKQAANRHWPFTRWSNRGSLRAVGFAVSNDTLFESERLKQLASEIWRANGGFCGVEAIISRHYVVDDNGCVRSF